MECDEIVVNMWEMTEEALQEYKRESELIFRLN